MAERQMTAVSDQMRAARSRSVQQYGTELKERWKSIVGVGLAGAMLLSAWQIGSASTTEHEATATVLLRPTAATEAIEGRSSTTEIERALATHREVAGSDEIVALVEDETGRSLSASEVNLDPAADGLLFRAVADNAEDAALIANSWATIYVREADASRQLELTQTLRELEATFEELEEDRAATIAPLRAMQEELGAEVDPDRRSTMIRAIDVESDRIEPQIDRIDSEIRSVSSDLAQLDLAVLREASPLELTRRAVAAEPAPSTLIRDLIARLAGGLLIGLLLALVGIQLDRRVRFAGQIEALGIPVLAVVPEIGRDVEDASRVVELAPRHAAAGSYNIARTALAPLLKSRDQQQLPSSVAVVSAAAGDGRTSVANNLVAALNAAGDSAVLAGVVWDNLSVDDLTSERRQPGREDRDRASLVVYDTSPLSDGGDPLDVAGSTDTSILVVRRKRSLEDVHRATELIERAGGKVLGAVYIDAAPTSGPRRRVVRGNNPSRSAPAAAAPPVDVGNSPR